jgi:hypothetical protein
MKHEMPQLMCGAKSQPIARRPVHEDDDRAQWIARPDRVGVTAFHLHWNADDDDPAALYRIQDVPDRPIWRQPKSGPSVMRRVLGVDPLEPRDRDRRDSELAR